MIDFVIHVAATWFHFRIRFVFVCTESHTQKLRRRRAFDDRFQYAEPRLAIEVSGSRFGSEVSGLLYGFWVWGLGFGFGFWGWFLGLDFGLGICLDLSLGFSLDLGVEFWFDYGV